MAIHEVRRSALVTFSPEQMFDLVVDVERYPQFLPWVTGAELHEKSERDLLASMEMQRAGVSERFTTRNTFERPSTMPLRRCSVCSTSLPTPRSVSWHVSAWPVCWPRRTRLMMR
jgi:ribosome-associated toxin RatA of RatAB toxin-antitoxin module